MRLEGDALIGLSVVHQACQNWDGKPVIIMVKNVKDFRRTMGMLSEANGLCQLNGGTPRATVRVWEDPSLSAREMMIARNGVIIKEGF